jgi:HlyD family secretion protein
MVIPRPSARAKLIRRIMMLRASVLLIDGVTFGLSRFRPAAPSVGRATVWSEGVKIGSIVLEVRGVGTLIPENIVWIPAQIEAPGEKILLRQLYGLRMFGIMSLLTALAVFAAVAAAAISVPMRATKIDPMASLRYQ